MSDDVAVYVEGVAPSDTECELHLLLDGTDTAPLESITEEFSTTFYVSSCERKYTLRAVCGGKVVYEKEVVFPDEETSQPYDLGNIGRR